VIFLWVRLRNFEMELLWIWERNCLGCAGGRRRELNVVGYNYCIGSFERCGDCQALTGKGLPKSRLLNCKSIRKLHLVTVLGNEFSG
jgi:hypothetical protein